MDFLDPKNERRSQFKLLLGYCLVTLAIAGASLVLMYQAYGFQLNRQGQVTQNGLLFVSSQPSGSSIYMNGSLYPAQTDSRVTVPAGAYTMKITRPGYRNWERPIYVAGGDVQHFDYPFLFPGTLKSNTLANISNAPTLLTQSPDQRWLIYDKPDNPGSFTVFDMKDPKKPVSTTINLPAGTFTTGDGAQTWTLEEWSSDNRHVVLNHTYVTKGVTNHEYILLDHDTPSNSTNLTFSLNLSQHETLSLFNNQTSQVFVYNTDDDSLQRINVNNGVLVSKLQHVLAFKTYADNKILYVTDQPLNGKIITNQVDVVLQDGQQSYTLRTLPSGAPTYVLNLAQYAGDWYVAVGASNDSSVYVYKNPQGEPANGPDIYPAPWRRLVIANPNYLSFSNNTQFLLAESGQDFVVYDFENVIEYRYRPDQPLDQPQLHVTWMDGDRLMYVSNGRLEVFDYDYRNQQSLMPASASYLSSFSSNYAYVYSISSQTSTIKDSTIGGTELTSTAMLTPADQ